MSEREREGGGIWKICHIHAHHGVNFTHSKQPFTKQRLQAHFCFLFELRNNPLIKVTGDTRSQSVGSGGHSTSEGVGGDMGLIDWVGASARGEASHLALAISIVLCL